MRRFIQEHPTLVARLLPRLVVTTLVAGALLFTPRAANATLTTGACLAQKQTVWGDLRKCQATERAKVLKGKPADLAKCQTKFQEKLAKISTKATKVGIPCRYRDNGDDTITDFDTGLMWEKKIDLVSGFECGFFNFPSCVTRTFTWDTAMTAFISELNGFTDSRSSQLGHAGHTDWRLPTVAELHTIVDATAPGCISGSPCIDPVLGPTVAGLYWSATVFASIPGFAFNVDFSNGAADDTHGKSFNYAVRAVRAGL